MRRAGIRGVLTTVTLLVLCACTGNALTPEEREYRRQQDLENWYRCMASGKTYHSGHAHRRGVVPRPGIVRQDLAQNNCKQHLGPYWID